MGGRTAANGLITAVAFIAGLTALTVLFWIAELGLPSAGDVVRRQGPHIVAVSCATVFVYACIRLALRNRTLFALALGLFVVAASLVAILDLAFLSYFGARFLQLRPFLPVGAAALPPFAVIWSYASQYVTVPILICATAPFLLSALLYARARTSHALVAAVAAICFAASFGANRIDFARSASAGVPQPIAGLLDQHDIVPRLLNAAGRSDAVIADKTARLKPRTIVLVINESVGHDLPSSEGSGKPLREKIAEISGAPERWRIFQNPVTNSNATDLSIPSIVTGSGTHESFDKLHAMPFLFDLAKARGYETALITSSVMKWANFEQFFKGAPIDRLYSAEVSGQPIINDLTIDDAFPFTRLAELLGGSDRDIFAVLYSNALHVPYQPTSAFPIPASLQDRRSRAISILESGYRLLFKSLHDSGRFEDSLLILVGDHGEFEFKGTPGSFAGIRLESYSDTILSPIFLLKPPSGLPAPMREALDANVARLVANLDIAPTIADMLGVRPKPPLSYAGYSLFAPVPEGRVSFALSTNAWRNWRWTAFAVARERQRLVCTSLRLCELRELGAASGTNDTAQIMQNDLMRKALREPALLQSLAKIYRDHFARSR